MSFIKTFSQLSAKDVTSAGGKGASLGEMTQAGIPVPPGFVISAAAFDRFLAETGRDVEIEAMAHEINPEDVNSVDRVSNVIRDLIKTATMPADLKKEIRDHYQKLNSPYVAVRSSATAEDSAVTSWAGELESFLNTDAQNLLENVKKCWASLFTTRAIFYRYEHGLRDINISVAVVVQAMIQSEIAGICFTVHPVTEDYKQMVIEAGWGLGEAIVGGQITPDTYVVHTDTWQILEKNISEQRMMIVRASNATKEQKVPVVQQTKQKLTDTQIIALGKLCQKIEKHYKAPQDIEWALYKKKFYIVQARPITTLKS